MKKIPYTLDTLSGLMIFQISGIELCADLKEVLTVIKPADMNLTPDELFSSKKKIRYRNFSIPLIPIHKVLKLNRKIPGADARIMVIEISGKLIAFLADKIIEILTIDPVIINNINILEDDNDEMIRALLEFEDREVLVPDYRKIYASTYVEM